MTDADVTRAIFITGAASGMGRATARLFAQRDWFVGAVDVDVDGLSTLEAELPLGRRFVRPLDVTDATAFAAVLTTFFEAAGRRLDVMFNNAGIGRGGPFADMALEDALRVVDVNLKGVIIGIHSAIPFLKATPNALCFSTSSSSATFGMAQIAVYSATKHAVRGLTEALSVELAPAGVRVADTLPGLIDTPILPPGSRDRAPPHGMFRLLQPDVVAQTVWNAYHEDTASGPTLHWLVPEELRALDLAARRAPEAVRDLFLRGEGALSLSQGRLEALS